MSEPMDVTAVAERSGTWWAVEVPEIPGLFTQAHQLTQIESMVRDAAHMLGREVDTVSVKLKLPQQDEHMSQPSSQITV